MDNENYAIDTAARFGDIPFVEFTKELVTGVFDSLVEAHILQMEEFATFVNSLTQDLSTYINNTVDGVSFDQISEFILNYELPEVKEDTLETVLSTLKDPTGAPELQPSESETDETKKWWAGLIEALAPAVRDLVNKIRDPNLQAQLNAIADYNESLLSSDTASIPTYEQIHDAIAALITSNKYGLLQTMAKQGMMRLVVTEGEIETKITFSTWNTTSSGSESSSELKTKIKSKNVSGRGILLFFRKKKKAKKRIVTVNTAKSYQRDSSGTRVDIFGRVNIKFKTDYAPLNG